MTTYEKDTQLSPAERATVERFGLDEPDEEIEYDPERWVVHIIGPDDIEPADGMLDAIRRAHAINAANVGPGGYYGDATEDREFMTLAWAVPAKWGWV